MAKPIGSMVLVYMVTWIPSIYPVSINLPAPWILWPNVHLAVDNQKDPLPSQVSVDSWNPKLASFLQTKYLTMIPVHPHSTLDHHDWCLNHLKSSYIILNHYVWCLHHHFSYFSWPITTFWICKSRCFRLRIPGFGAETKTRRSRPAFSCRSRRLALLSSTSCRAAGAEAWFSAMFVGLPSGKLTAMENHHF